MRRLIEHFDFAGSVVALIGLLVFGAAESKGSWSLRLVSLALISLGLLLTAIYAIVEKEVRFGRRLMSSHTGIRAQLMGGIYLVLAIAVAAGLVRELVAPNTLVGYVTSSAGLPVVIFVAACCFTLGGAAMLLGKSHGRDAAPGCMVLPQKIFGFVVMTVSAVIATGAAIEIIAPGRAFAIVRSFVD